MKKAKKPQQQEYPSKPLSVSRPDSKIVEINQDEILGLTEIFRLDYSNAVNIIVEHAIATGKDGLVEHVHRLLRLYNSQHTMELLLSIAEMELRDKNLQKVKIEVTDGMKDSIIIVIKNAEWFFNKHKSIQDVELEGLKATVLMLKDMIKRELGETIEAPQDDGLDVPFINCFTKNTMKN